MQTSQSTNQLASQNITLPKDSTSTTNHQSLTLFLTEILPNPQGKDGNNEFIEITNLSNKPIDLAGYSLDDSENGSKPYKIPQIQIAPGQALAFYKSETKIALNNTNDEARLFSPTGELLDKITYTKTTEGKSLSIIKVLSQPKTAESSKPSPIKPTEKFATLWTDPSPNNPPETFYKFEGNADSVDRAGASILFHPFSSTKTISITSKNPINPMLNATLKQNPQTTLSLLTKKISNSEFELIDYKILATTTTTENQNKQQSQAQTNQSQLFSPTSLILISLTLLVIALTVPHLLKKKHKTNTMSP
jgi:hypothetical protein